MPTLFLTGAAGGLGTAVTSWFLEREWKVAGVVHHEDIDYKKKFSAHKNFLLLAADATNEKGMSDAANKTKEQFGSIDAALFTVGGIHKWMNIEELSLEEFHRVMNMNLTSAFVSSRAVLNVMKSGVLVFIAAQPA